jgi:hypothetical protein
MLSHYVVQSRCRQQILVVPAVAGAFGDDHLRRSQAPKRIDRRFDDGGMGIDDAVGIELHEVGLSKIRFPLTSKPHNLTPLEMMSLSGRP